MSEKTVQNEVNASRAASVGLTELVRLNVAWLVSFLGPVPTHNGMRLPSRNVIQTQWWSTQRLLRFLREECFGLFDDSNPNCYRPQNKDGTDTERPFGNNTADMVWLPTPIPNALREALRTQQQQLEMWGHLWFPYRVQGSWTGANVDEWVFNPLDRKPLSNGATRIECEAWVIPDEMRDRKTIGRIETIGLTYRGDDMLTELDFNPQARVNY